MPNWNFTKLAGQPMPSLDAILQMVVDGSVANFGARSVTLIAKQHDAQVQLLGQGLTFDTEGQPTGGTITGFVVRIGGANVLVKATDLSVSLTEFWTSYQADFAPGLKMLLFAGRDVINGGIGHDILEGGASDDDLFGGAGGDQLYGGTGVDRLDGGKGVDFLNGDSESDGLFGGAGIDTLIGGEGDDRLFGGSGNDSIFGGDGSDRLTGGAGKDLLRGDGGRDAFVFTTKPVVGHVDVIEDFSTSHGNEDAIHLSLRAFAGTGPKGILADGRFHNGKIATEADDRILYDAASGNIWYDADGSGKIRKVLFAQVTPGTALTSDDFFVF